jgi:hypothetical protein
VVLIPAAIRLVFGAKQVRSADAPTVSDRAILGSVAGELTAVRDAARGGWSGDLAARAATALRIAAGYAIRRPPRQRVLDGDAPADGRLVVTRRGFKTRRIAVASPVTAQELTEVLEKLPLTTPHERRTLLEDVRNALAAVTRSIYAAEHADTDLDEAVAAGLRVTEQLRRRPA